MIVTAQKSPLLTIIEKSTTSMKTYIVVMESEVVLVNSNGPGSTDRDKDPAALKDYALPLWITMA